MCRENARLIVSARWRVVRDEPGRPLVIRDVGPWDRFASVTNDVESVVAYLHRTGQLAGRRLLYYDSEGDLAAETYRDERDLERGLRENAEADLASCRPLLGSTQVLLAQVTDERDAFQRSLDDALRRLDPGFLEKLLRGLPEIGGGAAAGAVVAVVNDGSVALGAGIGAAAAVVVRAVF